MITGKEPLAALEVERIGGKGPELRRDHHAEDADPHKEGERSRYAEVRGASETQHVHGEEKRHGLQQPRPVQPAAHRAVRGDQEHQHQRDHRDTVRADFAEKSVRMNASRSALTIR